jgi:uncharacterized protein YcnI
MKIHIAGTAFVAAGALLVLGNIAEAHTTISPRQSIAGAMEKYTVRVPAEGQMTAKGAEVEVPEGVTVANFATPAGWTYEVKRQDGRVAAIRWRMDIKPGEFAEFSFVARNPQNAGQLIWKLREFFADGTVTDYTNGPDGLYPGAVVKLSPN